MPKEESEKKTSTKKAAEKKPAAKKAAAPKAEAKAKPVAKKTNSAAAKLTGDKIPSDAGYGTGRRKSSIAKVWVYPGTGELKVNKLSGMEYFQNEALVQQVTKPLEVLNLAGKYDITISTLSGGKAGQADAALLGVARALLSLDENFKPTLKTHQYLSRDSRVKERKKYGRRGARKMPQYRKR